MTAQKTVLRPDPYDAVWREFCEALHKAIRVRQVAGSPSRPRSSPGTQTQA
jgi:hypothetical protein